MKKVQHLFLLVLILPLFAFGVHKYYLSLTKIDYIKESQSVQITARIFIDDLETSLNKNYDESFKLATDNELDKTNSFIEEYLAKFLKIKINNELKSFRYLGKKYESDVVFLFAEIEGISSIKVIEVQNRILMDDFEEQQNIIKLTINDKKKSFILTVDSDKDLLKF